MQRVKRLIAITGVVVGAVAASSAHPAEGRLDGSDGASARVTLSARPTTLTWSQGATLFGAVDNGREHEIVTIEAKDCPLTSFTEVASVQTGSQGAWTIERFGTGVTSVIRAAWKGATSEPVTLRQIPRLQLDRLSRSRFQVGVPSKGQMWRKKVLFQRRSRGSWITVKTVTLTDTFGGAGRAFVWTEAEFKASVPRGSIVRAALPASQARPCYLATVSNTVRA